MDPRPEPSDSASQRSVVFITAAFSRPWQVFKRLRLWYPVSCFATHLAQTLRDPSRYRMIREQNRDLFADDAPLH
jgi:hypothetical protein